MPRTDTDAEQVYSYNKSHYGELISGARHRMGMTQLQLAQQLNVSKNIITHWEAGRVKPDLNLIPQLCRALHITLEDFFQEPLSASQLTPREQKLIAVYRSLSSREKLILESALQKVTDLNEEALWTRCSEGFIKVFRNHQTAAAGTAGGLDSASGEMVYIRRNRQSLRAREIITVNGDSMKPRYLNGQDVYVEPVSDLRIGEIGVFVVNGAGYIKQRQMDRLHSLNPAYPDIMFGETDDIRCYGRVIGVVSPADYPTPEEQAILEEINSTTP